MRFGFLILLASLAALPAGAAKKYIFSSWDLGDVTPQEILMCADQFADTACDGIAISLAGALPGYDSWHRRHLVNDPGWRYAEVAHLEDVLRRIVSRPFLKESFIFAGMSPTNRLAWTDDRAWAAFANNAGVFARLAKRGGLRGLVTDFEDYYRQKQYLFLPEKDGDYRKTLRLTRQRGREVFARVFAEYPDAVILTFYLLTADSAYTSTDDPVGVMLDKEDLWPAFVNGILDAMPPTARLVDGNENDGYHARADRKDFHTSVTHQLVSVLPLVAKENVAKYRSQVSAGFGLYMDSYTAPTNSGWYMEPKRGKRINHFEDNLRAATECTDEYVWFWGEKGFWIDWPVDLKERSGNTWRSSGGGTWRGKYYEGRWGRIKPWREMMDGDFDLMARGVKEPVRCVKEQRAKQKADGTFKNLFTMPDKVGPGGISRRIAGLEVDGWYGVRALGRGRIVRGNAYFQYRGSWRWNLGAFRMQFGKPGADGWREGFALVRIPDGASDIFLILDGKHGDKEAKAEFKDVEVFRIR